MGIQKRLVTVTMAGAIVMAQVTSSFAQSRSGGGVIDRYSEALAACDRAGDVGAAVKPLFTKIFSDEVTEAVVAAAIDKQWTEQSGSALLASEFRTVGEKAIADAPVIDKWNSVLGSLQQWVTGGSPPREIVEFTRTVIEKTLAQPQVQRFFEGLSQAAVAEVAANVEKAMTDGGFESLRKCFKANVSARYNERVGRFALETVLPPEKVESVVKPQVDTRTGGVVAAVSVAVIVLMRRLVTRMAVGLAQRLAGRLVASAVGKAVTGFGVLLLALDIWHYTQKGVFDLVVDGIQKPEVIDSIRTEVKAETAKTMRDEAGRLGEAAAAELNKSWLAFRANHSIMIDMLKHDSFRRFIDELGEDVDLARMSKAVRIAGGKGDTINELAILKAVGDGSLLGALAKLDDIGLDVAADLGSLHAGLAWHNLAGPELSRVARLGLHKVLKITDESASSIGSLLAFKNDAIVMKLASQPRDLRDYFVRLPREALTQCLLLLSPAEVASVAEYLGKLDDQAQGRFNQGLLDVKELATFRQLLTPRAASAVLASRNQDLALKSIGFDQSLVPLQIWSDTDNVARGQLSWLVLVYKYPVVMGVLLLLASLPVMIVARWILAVVRWMFGRKPRIGHQ